MSRSQQRLRGSTVLLKHQQNEKLREREYSKRAVIGRNNRYKDANSQIRPKLMSRDDRLKAPKSSHFQGVKERLKVMQKNQPLENKKQSVSHKNLQKLNQSVDNPYNTLLNDKR